MADSTPVAPHGRVLLIDDDRVFGLWATKVLQSRGFFIQHVLGWVGMTRRVYTYPDLPALGLSHGWAIMNLISTIGAFVIGLSTLTFVWAVIDGLRNGAPAGDNPWDAYTLEWATSSPPPIHNFERVPPIRSRRPLWDLNHPELADWRDAGAHEGDLRR